MLAQIDRKVNQITSHSFKGFLAFISVVIVAIMLLLLASSTIIHLAFGFDFIESFKASVAVIYLGSLFSVIIALLKN